MRSVFLTESQVTERSAGGRTGIRPPEAAPVGQGLACQVRLSSSLVTRDPRADEVVCFNPGCVLGSSKHGQHGVTKSAPQLSVPPPPPGRRSGPMALRLYVSEEEGATVPPQAPRTLSVASLDQHTWRLVVSRQLWASPCLPVPGGVPVQLWAPGRTGESAKEK